MTATSEKLEAVQAALRQQMEMFVLARRTVWAEGLADVDKLRYVCNEDLVLKHGRTFTRAHSPFVPMPKACFSRSYDIATRKANPKGWIYCEGYAIAPKCPMAVNHAWLTRADTPDLAYEVAWDWGGAEDTVYFGMAFEADYVRKVHYASKRQFYSVLDHWWGANSYPLLTGEVKIEDVMWKGESNGEKN